MPKKKIGFSDLNGWLKMAAIGGWITLVSFIAGFIAGLLAPY